MQVVYEQNFDFENQDDADHILERKRQDQYDRDPYDMQDEPADRDPRSQSKFPYQRRQYGGYNYGDDPNYDRDSRADSSVKSDTHFYSSIASFSYNGDQSRTVKSVKRDRLDKNNDHNVQQNDKTYDKKSVKYKNLDKLGNNEDLRRGDDRKDRKEETEHEDLKPNEKRGRKQPGDDEKDGPKNERTSKSKQEKLYESQPISVTPFEPQTP